MAGIFSRELMTLMEKRAKPGAYMHSSIAGEFRKTELEAARENERRTRGTKEWAKWREAIGRIELERAVARNFSSLESGARRGLMKVIAEIRGRPDMELSGSPESPVVSIPWTARSRRIPLIGKGAGKSAAARLTLEPNEMHVFVHDGIARGHQIKVNRFGDPHYKYVGGFERQGWGGADSRAVAERLAGLLGLRIGARRR
ncbi:MAG: hypothetical protein V1708_04550 [Candidatus Micrarchaeota archaeon]